MTFTNFMKNITLNYYLKALPVKNNLFLNPGNIYYLFYTVTFYLRYDAILRMASHPFTYLALSIVCDALQCFATPSLEY